MLQIWLSNISYYTSLLILIVLTFQYFNVSGVLGMACGNVLFQLALTVSAGEHLGQALQ
jgi:hypothetical protein